MGSLPITTLDQSRGDSNGCSIDCVVNIDTDKGACRSCSKDAQT